MTIALKLGGKVSIDDLFCQVEADKPCWQNQNVGVVVLARQAGKLGAVTQSRSDTVHLVGDDAHAHSRATKQDATRVFPFSHSRIQELQKKYSQEPGIFEIAVEAKQGNFLPGEDLLFIVVAGDIRPNVKRVLAEFLEDVKTTCFEKKEKLA